MINDNECMVTVVCTAFNHAKYIEKTIEGFINQKTNFKYKVLIHDDASTDNTQEIVRKYAELYPDIIVPILQTENKYSKGIDLFEHFIYPMVDSKYMASCEGDDYWVDDTKLQKQFDYMEQHEDCMMCVHNTMKINEPGEALNMLCNPLTEDKDYYIDEVISAGGGTLFHTSSYFYRSDVRIAIPDVFVMKSIGDYPVAIYMATKGYIHYMADVMSAYRVGALESWTNRFNQSKEARIKFYQEMMQALDKMNAYTNYKHDTSFRKIYRENEYLYLFETSQRSKILKDDEYRIRYKENTAIVRLKHWVKSWMRRV